MPLGSGSTLQGIWKYGEDDLNSLASDLLNRLGDSVRTKTESQAASIQSLLTSYSLVEAATGIRHYSVATTTDRDAITGMSTNDLCEVRSDSAVYRYTGTVWRLWHSEWESVTLGSGWSATIALSARSLSGMVVCRGRVAGGTSGTTAFTLPSRLRPAGVRRLPVVTGASGGVIACTINADGTVVASTTDFTLDGIQFTVYND